uniref:RING-type E3 ubiquitin transferase n=2 Tax=Opuntia streptacantha TaxID=393608 RepID=A0A7C9EYC4_OPUST
MGSDEPKVGETQLHPPLIKVHLALCTRLLQLVDRISSVIPEIEAARPRCSSGIKALSLLHETVEKAKILVQNCRESSKLYLALTGDVILSRFERTSKLLQQSLRQLQNVVPVVLEFEISEILNTNGDAVFFLDSHEDEAGKALRALLQQDASLINYGDTEIEVLQFAAVRLRLTSQKDLLVERRSIRKLLDEVKEENSTKRTALGYLLHILKKYDKQILQQQPSLPITHSDGSFEMFNNTSFITNSTHLESCPTYAQDEAQARMLYSSAPPEEFLCPISSRLMYDPVIVSSGQTFERSSIQKWFEKGHDICPKTGLKLVDLSLIPNTGMRDLILKWSMEHLMIVSDSSIQTSVSPSLETSSNSICSTSSSLKDLPLQMDASSKSFLSIHHSYSDLSHAKVEYGFSSIREPSDDYCYSFQFFHDIDDIKTQLLSNVGGLPWESKCRAVQDVNYYLMYYNPSCAFVSSENFLEPLIQFLKDALDKRDVEAEKSGCLLFLTFLGASRREAGLVSEDFYTLLASLLETEAIAESLAIMEVLSTQVSAFPNLASSNVLTSIMKVLDGPKGEFQLAAVRILYNLSSNFETSPCNLALDWIPKLVPFLGDSLVASTCIGIFQNLCNVEEAQVTIAETDGCIAAIIDLLETGSSENQERAAGILLLLCAQHDHCCHLVLHEGIVPALCILSVNGNEKAKVSASELLRILRDVKYEDEDDYPRSNVQSSAQELPENFNEKNKSSSGMSGSFRRKMKTFLKKKLMLSAH